MVHSRNLSILVGVLVLTLTSACDPDDNSAVESTGVYSLEPTAAPDPNASPPQDTTTDTAPGAPAEPRGEPNANEARPTVGDDGDPDTGEPSSTPEANEPSTSDLPSGDEEAAAERWEHQPLATDSPEMVAFQREVVALPAGYDGSVFTPPGHEGVTIANRYTDRLSHADAVAFMRESLEDAGWQVTDEHDAPRDTVRLEAERGTETAKVLIQLGASMTGAPDLVAITVEHTS
jgi:hypothetical protein